MNNLFYSLEDGKYYTYPDGDEVTGIQIRKVIEANERSISKLQQETEKLKKQYCERTDCGGRIGNSKKVEELQKENQQLKKQLEETKEMIEKCGFVNIEQVMLSYCGLIAQQKEFILYLRHLSNWYSADGVRQGMVNEILQKYKEIIGGKDV